MENQELEQEENLQALVQLQGNIVRYKTMADGTMRLELDLGKINSKIASDLHVLNEKLNITIILSTEDLLEQAKSSL